VFGLHQSDLNRITNVCVVGGQMNYVIFGGHDSRSGGA
jgi:hypothetical protein